MIPLMMRDSRGHAYRGAACPEHGGPEAEPKELRSAAELSQTHRKITAIDLRQSMTTPFPQQAMVAKLHYLVGESKLLRVAVG